MKMARNSFHFTTTSLLTLLFLSAICAVVSPSNAQNATGFISIDCGSNLPQYKDSQTGLIWFNDSEYTRTGSNGLVSSTVDSKLDNSKALQTFRYFPVHRNKHCYDLKLSTSSPLVLIRAMFFRGNASQLSLPLSFDVSINANIWFTVQYNLGRNVEHEDPIVREGLFHATPILLATPLLYVCLLPNQSVPFISSLEVRPLDPGGEMYNLSNRDQLYLSTLLRLNTGPPPNAPTVRYPDDVYDRLWVNGYPHMSNGTIRRTKSPVPVESQNLRLNDVPIEVLSDAWDWASPNGTRPHSKVFAFSFPEASNRALYLHPVLYFEPGKSPPSNLSYVGITYNNEVLGERFNVTSTTAQAFEHLVLPKFNNQASFNIVTTSPVLSAIEFYEEVINDPSMTTDGDVLMVNFLKSIYNKQNWQGDPCLPVPYSWLTCRPREAQYGGEIALKYIDHMNLSHVSNGDELLNLNFSNPYAFRSLSLAYSQINDTILDHLLSRSSGADRAHFEYLYFDHNLITNVKSLLRKNSTNVWSLRILKLSHNLFTGSVPSFANASFFNTLQNLDLSHNKMTSLPLQWGNSTTASVLESLTSLDLSSNSISSDISGLSPLVKGNPSLVTLNLSHNLMKGEFPSSLYFSLKDIKTIDFNDNLISGVLDLTSWHKNLLWVCNSSAVHSMTDISQTNIGQVFSFVNNKIIDINPNIETLEPIINFFLQRSDNFSRTEAKAKSSLSILHQGGILLGGNPFCKHPKSRSQKYICRSSVNEIVPKHTKNKSDRIAVTVVAALGGVSFIICSVVVVLVVWKYYKEVRVLRSIQYALVTQDVHPRFYLYSDIKHATQNFNADNMLGKGGFGVVYKGAWQDKAANSISIAVKKLFGSAEERVLNDFLNEVLLISGIQHRNLVQLKGCCIKEKERILIYEFAEGGNLAKALWGKGPSNMVLDWNTRYNICIGIARGLAYLHEELQPRIIHRDIKATNILLDANANPKIADFGLAKPISIDASRTLFTKNVGGTLGYIAPEHASQGQLTEKSDVFSFGILLLEIISGRKCIEFTLDTDEMYIKDWVERLHEEGTLMDLLQQDLVGSCPEDQVLKLIHIALICLQPNPKSRPKMSEVISMLVGNVEMVSFLNGQNTLTSQENVSHTSYNRHTF